MFRAAKMLVVFLILCIERSVGVSAAAEQAVVKNLAVAKYMGRWYQIASFRTRFQPMNYVNTRATYTLQNPNGTFHVLNESWEDITGHRISIEGIACKAHPKSDEAKFKVAFFGVPVLGDYWVLYVDDKYRYALVGHPTKEYLWVLNRKPQLDDKIYNQLVEKAQREGYDVSKLRKTPQSQNPPPKGF